MVWLRKAAFQLHLWSGIGIGLYVLVVSVTGSIVVYSNELYRAATRDPIIVIESGAPLTDDQLRGTVTLAISRSRNPDEAVTILFKRGADLKHHLFNPSRSGQTDHLLSDLSALSCSSIDRLCA
jgi:uncharacterized iron-regulated membrane protein